MGRAGVTPAAGEDRGGAEEVEELGDERFRGRRRCFIGPVLLLLSLFTVIVTRLAHFRLFLFFHSPFSRERMGQASRGQG